MSAGYNQGLYTGYMKDLRCVYAIDVSRLPEDIIGSTAQSQVSVQVSISVDVNADAASQLCATSDAVGITATQLANHDLYVYLEKV